jgi:hypothetical protein
MFQQNEVAANFKQGRKAMFCALPKRPSLLIKRSVLDNAPPSVER